MTNLSELKRLHAEATAGEWKCNRELFGGEFHPWCDEAEVFENQPWIAAIHNAFPELAATIEQQEKTIATLREQLKTAIEDIQHWGLYASEYFQNKHNLAGCIAEHQKVLEATAKEAM